MQFVYHSVSNACVLQEKTGGGERKKIMTNLKTQENTPQPKKVGKKKKLPFAKPASPFNSKSKKFVRVKYNLKECIFCLLFQ